MALSLGFDVARSSLAAASEQVALVSRNIARVNDPDATRKIAHVITGPGSSVHVGRIDRVSQSVLLDKFLASNAESNSKNEMLAALDALDATIGDPNLGRSPAAMISRLGASLQRYSTSPDNAAAAAAAVFAARDVAEALNTGAATADVLRRQADADIKESVGRINALLSEFRVLNNSVVSGVRRGVDVTDSLDARDSILKSLSGEVGISTLSRADGDLAIFTNSGVMLFDKTPRSVSFSPTPLLGNGNTGAPVYADGVPIAGEQHTLSVSTGRLASLVTVRDEVIPTYQKQLDEIARGLIVAFAEFDQSPTPALPAAAGLFTYPGGPALPPAGTLLPGMAGAIRINSTVAPGGGNPLLLRDGGISSPGNPAFTYNATGAAAFTDRLQKLIENLDAAQSFDPSAQIPANEGLTGFARNSVAWLQSLRQDAKAGSDYANIVSERARAILAQETGISLDEEMTNMLELERTFQASSRLISAIDAMLDALMATAR